MKGLDPDLRALQEVRDCVARAKLACEAVHDYDQAAIDRVCAAMAAAGASAAYELARLAVEETGIGRVHYKVQKNLLGSEGVWESIAGEKTVGVITRDEARGVLEVATPVGIVAGIVPTTNPTSTALYKALISVKGRNAIVISPHPRAQRCISETVEILRRAIQRAGGPPDLVCCLSAPTIESTGALMKHRDVAVILSTGGSGLVRAAYSSGKPAYGVGPGNVPAYIDRSADVEAAARAIVASQSFDNATLCCSEQALVLDRPIAERMLASLLSRGAHLCNEQETAQLAAFCSRDGHMNADVVGLDPSRVAELAGFRVPKDTSLLLARQGGVGREWPLSIEILCPLLSVHEVDGWQQGCETSKAILYYGGLGHTMSVWATDKSVQDAFFLEKPASRIIANGPSSMGAVGFSTNLVPAMSLGCGPQAGNITSDNITARHLVNLKRVAFPKRNWLELERSFHERAARWTGDAAPRGSGLVGDPALALGAASPAAAKSRGEPVSSEARASTSRAEPTSNWRGNPAFAPTFTDSRREPTRQRTTTPSSATLAQPAPARAAATTPVSSPARVPAQPKKRAPAGPPRSTEVGQALSSIDIESIMQHAGSGCPLGPCKGCPQSDVRTGACTA